MKLIRAVKVHGDTTEGSNQDRVVHVNLGQQEMPPVVWNIEVENIWKYLTMCWNMISKMLKFCFVLCIMLQPLLERDTVATNFHHHVIELVSSRQHCNTLDLGLWRERKHLQAPSQALRPLHIRSHKCMIYNKAFGIAADCGKHAFFQKRSKGHFRIKRNRKYQNRTYHQIQEDQADHEDQYSQIVVCSYQ